MQSNHFNRNFIRQFLIDSPIFPVPAKRLFSSSASRSFAWTKNKSILSETIVLNSLSDTARASRLINNLQYRDIAATDRLLSYLQNLGKIFKSYANDEPATAGYFYSLSSSLKGLHSLVLSFQQKVQIEILKKLNDLMLKKKKEDVVYFYQSQIEATLKEIPPFVNQLLRYDGHYRSIIKNESGSQQGITVTTQAEQYLLKLAGHIEDLLSVTEDTQASLWNWHSFMSKLEWQEIYN